MFCCFKRWLKTLELEKYDNLTVKSIRKKLAEDLDEEQFKTYMEFYQYYKGGSKKMQEKMTEFKKQFKILKTMIGGTNNFRKI